MISFKYDTADRIVEASDDSGNRRSYEYDSSGHLETVADASGVLYSFRYSHLLDIQGYDPYLLTTRCSRRKPAQRSDFRFAGSGLLPAEDLARMGLHVFLMDAEGWGRSSPAPETASELVGDSKQVVSDIGTVVEDVVRRTGYSRILLFGHASGGHWAAIYTTQHPEPVAGLILLNSMYGVEAPWGLQKGF